MDLTTLFGDVFLAPGPIGVNTVRHAGSIVVEVTPPPQISGEVIDQATLEAEFDDQLYAIGRTQSVIEPPEIRTSRDQGPGMALAHAVNASELVYALQTVAGYRRQALLNSTTFENYGEVATLCFHLSWKDNEAVTRSKFSNPSVVSFH